MYNREDINEQETYQENESPTLPIETNPTADTGKHQPVQEDEMNHTPGPWKALWNGHYYDVKCSSEPGSDEITDTSPGICSTDNNEHYSHTFSHEGANAYLIAAAPEMFDVLRWIKAGHIIGDEKLTKLINKAKGEY